VDRPFCELGDSMDHGEEAARILFEAFGTINSEAWPTMESARREVSECVERPNLCVGVLDGERLAGWVGLRPLYAKTWELHPLVIDSAFRGKGLGRRLLEKLEEKAREKGLIGIALGTDDDTFRTSLSRARIDRSNIFREIERIENLRAHPYEFYEKCGYMIVGLIPNANGRNKPDIWMWKSLVEE